MRFENKVALVTGGDGGIGLAVAKRLASEGARLVLVGLNHKKLQAVVPLVKDAGAPAVWTSVCDVAKEKKVEATVAGALRRFGQLDVIINNAGLMNFKPLEELTGDDWLRVLSVDLLGTFYFTKQAFLHMPKGGTIVNVSSFTPLKPVRWWRPTRRPRPPCCRSRARRRWKVNLQQICSQCTW